MSLIRQFSHRFLLASAVVVCTVSLTSCVSRAAYTNLPDPVETVIDFQYTVFYEEDIDKAFSEYTTQEYEEKNKEVYRILPDLVTKSAPLVHTKAKMNPMSKQKFIGNFLEEYEWTIEDDTASVCKKNKSGKTKNRNCMFVKLIEGTWKIYDSTGMFAKIS